MASLLLVIFAVEVAIYLVNTIGAATINNLVCSPSARNRKPPRRAAMETES